MKLPISYGRQYISDEDIQAVVETLKSDYLTCGPQIPEFEKAFCEYVNAKYSVAVCNATAALHIAAMALGVNPGDNIICTPMTFASSANSIRFCGGNVKFVDINPRTYLLDIDKLKETLAAAPKGTYKGMVLVDFAGYPHNMEEYREVADEYGLWILEDACHAPGAYFIDSTGEKVYCGCGKYSDITVFSFHPVKHITTGEGGIACTQNKEYYEKMALYRTHGITHDADKLQRQDGLWYYEMQELGFNYRITDIQAALGISQLKRARKNVELRRELVRKYNDAFADIEGIKTPYEAADVYHAYHLYVIQMEDRLGLYNFLRENKIYAQVLYYPLNLMPYYKQFGNKEGDLPVVEDYYKHCLALPMFPTLTDEQQQYVISKIKEFICKKNNMIILGNKIFLRRLTEDDVTEKYVQWMNDPVTNMYLESRFVIHTIESTKAFVRSSTNDNNYLFGIFLKETGEHIGNIKLGDINHFHKYADIGFLIGEKKYCGRGIATEAVGIATNFAFKELLLHKLYGGVYEPNKGSIRCFEKNGYKLEGIKKSQYQITKGSWIDCIMYGKVNE